MPALTSILDSQDLPIDAVITWVDGDDPAHQHKRGLFAEESVSDSDSLLLTGNDETRFIDNGEIRFTILSIRKFAPWIRTIHIVTDHQIPGFLTEDVRKKLGVNIVYHTHLFEGYEWALPTFNSRTLETAIWRIPELAPQFIYFNDDFLLASPVEPKHFFVKGKVVLRGQWKSIAAYGPLRMRINEVLNITARRFLGITRSMNLLLQTKSAQKAGLQKKYYRIPHVPHPIKTVTLQRFFAENGDDFVENIKHRFRSTEQFSGVYLAHHLEIKHKNAILKGTGKIVMINGETDISRVIRHKIQRIKRGRVRFLCIQGLERLAETDRNLLHESLEELVRD
ncbi:MAG: Stealth CR1 domain-containing protein [Balneolales bacterium]|nr:Stealth CR1 domain-containing protein [Balneolales bacterium]